MTRVTKDHGWAWIILLGAWVMQALTNGTDKVAGILLVEFVSLFDATSAATALMTGLLYGTMAVVSPFVIIIIARFDARLIGFVGGLIGGFCFVLLTFSPNITYASTIYGITMGISLTVSSLVSTVAVNQWFDKRRGLANGVMISGISIATMLLPILVRACIDHYGVRGALLIYSAVLLHISCGGLLLLPAQTEKEETCLDRSKTADEPVVMANGTFTDQCSKCLSMDELSAQQCTCHSVAFGYKLHNTTVHEIPNGSLPPKSQSAMIFIPTEPSFQHDNEKDTDKRLLHSSVGSLRRQHLRKKIGNHAISAQSLPNVDIASGNILKHFRPNWKIWSTSKLSEDHLQNTTKYEKNVQRTDLSFVVVLKRCDIMAYIFSINVAVIGLRNAFMFIPAYAEDWGISKLTTVYILVVMGIMDFVGSIATGVIADTAWVRTRYLLAGYLVVLGIVVILTSFFKGITSLIITSVTIGIFGGAFVGLFTACLREVAGDDHFPRAVSIHYFIQGVMFLPMPSLLGLTRDLAGSSENIFRICGAIMLLSSGMIACGAYRAYRRR